MNRPAIASALLLATLAAGAQAQSFTDNARVRAVEPQYQVVQVPRQECANQLVTEQPAPAGTNGIGGALIGGVAGGILGHQVGRGNGRDAATAVGAVAGALVGQNLANNQAVAAPPMTREVQSCRTVYENQNRLTGYRVTYEYRGYEYSTMMPEQPGPTIPVRVSVTPVAEYRR